MRVEANGIHVHCQVSGPAEAPWLIFGNSHATNLSMWEPQRACFAERFRVLVYDQRGHGETDAPDGRYAFATLIDDLVALMDELSIERAHYCGLSMGGATGMGLALRHPERIDHLTVCDSPCASSVASAVQWEERIAIARAHGMAALVDSTLARWFPPETLAANPAHVGHLRRMIASTPVNGYAGCAAALADHDFRTGLADVRMPVLLMVGEQDGVVPAAMKAMHAELPGSCFVPLAGAGHISNLDRPDAFNRALGEFLFSAGHAITSA
jgi:3-oxoadipate enol-lactonase